MSDDIPAIHSISNGDFFASFKFRGVVVAVSSAFDQRIESVLIRFSRPGPEDLTVYSLTVTLPIPASTMKVEIERASDRFYELCSDWMPAIRTARRSDPSWKMIHRLVEAMIRKCLGGE